MMTATRSPRRRASARSWLTKTAVVPVSPSARSKSSMSACRVGSSRAAKGSSRSRTSGSNASARARLVLCASPPDRVRAERRASDSMANRSSHRRTRPARSARGAPRRARPEPTLDSTEASRRRGSSRTPRARCCDLHVDRPQPEQLAAARSRVQLQADQCVDLGWGRMA